LAKEFLLDQQGEPQAQKQGIAQLRDQLTALASLLVQPARADRPQLAQLLQTALQ
jgi:hypothetical protein